MAGYRPRGWQRYSEGRVIVSVALDPPAARLDASEHRGLAKLTERLVDQLNQARLPATWGVFDPVHAAATSVILPAGIAAGVDHELAILGDAGWIGSAAGRPRMAKELARRVMQARSKGIDVTTLLLRDADPGDHFDLFVKQGITAVCSIPQTSPKTPRIQQPKTLRYGLWEIGVSAKLPLATSWFAGRKLIRSIEKTGREGGQFHLLIDAPAICQQGTAAEKSVEGLIGALGRLRDRGLLVAESMAIAAARLSDLPIATPQRSILRLAA